ncbi:hypothetical protein pipiens_012847, partial [Culex pipiens pipiens]
MNEICAYAGYLHWTGQDRANTMLHNQAGRRAVREQGSGRKSWPFSAPKMSQTSHSSGCRTICQCWQTLNYGTGSKEPDRIMGLIGFITNMIDHVYYPVDKICWMIEYKLPADRAPGPVGHNQFRLLGRLNLSEPGA